MSMSVCGQAILDSVRNVDTAFYGFINDWMGSRYRVGGMTKNGVDCSGFTKVLYENLYRIHIPRVARDQYKFTTRIIKDSLKMGDLVFFRTNTRTTWHVGVYLMNGFFIHSENRRTGVKLNNLSDTYYHKTYYGAGRI